MTRKSLTIWSPKAGYYSVSECVKYPTNLKSLYRSTYPQREKNATVKYRDRFTRKKNYDMVPQSWILYCLRIYKISDGLIKFMEKAMETRRIEMAVGGKKINRSIKPERHIPGWWLITITIFNSDDSTQSHAQGIHKWIQTK